MYWDLWNLQIDGALAQGVDAVRSLVLNGFNDRITRFNLGQKYKYNKVWASIHCVVINLMDFKLLFLEGKYNEIIVCLLT